jgi:hypothetical protein
MEPCEDPDHKGNNSKYHSGLPCDVDGCKEPAGTVWSPYWCQKHNAERMMRITKSLNEMVKKMAARKDRDVV